jgi:hypothetical protein
MIELTQQQGLAMANEQNPIVFDPRTKITYVLVRKEVFDRITSLLYDDSELSHDELRLHLARASQANGWDEPGMEDYDNYDEHRK